VAGCGRGQSLRLVVLNLGAEATEPGDERSEAGCPGPGGLGGSPPIEKGDEGAFRQQFSVPLALAGGSRGSPGYDKPRA
jgi:hypothetical protein